MKVTEVAPAIRQEVQVEAQLALQVLLIVVEEAGAVEVVQMGQVGQVEIQAVAEDGKIL